MSQNHGQIHTITVSSNSPVFNNLCMYDLILVDHATHAPQTVNLNNERRHANQSRQNVNEHMTTNRNSLTTGMDERKLIKNCTNTMTAKQSQVGSRTRKNTVQIVVRHIGSGSNVKYVVRWNGCGAENESLEPPDHMHQHFLARYF